MFTYTLQNRILRLPAGTRLLFPNDVTIAVTLAPRVAFGVSKGYSRNAIVGGELRAVQNLTRGTFAVKYADAPPFEPLSATTQVADTRLVVKGNLVEVSSICEGEQDLTDLISALYYAFPAILTVYYPDAPIPVSVTGKVGDAPFEWVYDPETIPLNVIVTSKENQERLLTDSWNMVAIASGIQNRRLIAGLHYFHVACRLLACGINRFEFLAEALLNFSKALQSLFGDKRDHVRNELRKLKIEEHDIEAKYIPTLVLRDDFDIAHVSLAMLDRKQLLILHRHANHAEASIRELLKVVLQGVKSGTYALPPDTTLKLSKKKRSILKRLQKNLPQTPPNR